MIYTKFFKNKLQTTKDFNKAPKRKLKDFKHFKRHFNISHNIWWTLKKENDKCKNNMKMIFGP